MSVSGKRILKLKFFYISYFVCNVLKINHLFYFIEFFNAV